MKMETNIKVAVRVRPYSRKEMEQSQQCIIKVLDHSTLIFDPENEDDEFFYQGVKQTYRDITKRTNKKLSMDFDMVFDTQATNVEIFNECTVPLVDAVLNGYNCSVFVYGATGAGKTFTMLGNLSNPGLTYLTMQNLFDKVSSQKEKTKFDIGVSYLEVYNEQVMNLLTKTGPLKLREDPEKGVVVSGLVLKPILSAEELLQMLTLGNANRTQHPTDANAESSRSHAVFQVHIRMTNRKTGTKRTVKLSMIDLAGSERAASTKGMGLRFKEGASINKSLLALGNCINKLADGQKHIPYRDSNLTRLLKDSLGGNCRTLMVANVSMSSLTYEDTYNTLKYASRAKKIRSTLHQNVMKTNMPKDFYVKKVIDLMAEIERNQELIKTLEAKLAQAQKTSSASSNVATVGRTTDDVVMKHWHKKIDGIYAIVLQAQEQFLQHQCKIKVLNLRKELQKQTETYKQFLTHNNPVERLKEIALIDQAYKTKIDVQNVEMTEWHKKYQEAKKNLECLRQELTLAKLDDAIHMYRHSKDLELRLAKKDMLMKFATFIHDERMREMQKIHPPFGIACKMLQSLASTFTVTQRAVYDNIVCGLTGGANDRSDRKRTNDVLDIDSCLNGKTIGPSSSATLNYLTVPSLSSSMDVAKKSRINVACDDDFEKMIMVNNSDDDDDFDDNDNGIPTNKNNNLHNATRVINCNDLNETYDCRLKSDGILKTNLINGILSDEVSHVPKNSKDQLKNVLIKSKTFNRQGLLKSVTACVQQQKENKKCSPGKVYKTSRVAATSKILIGSTKKQVVRNVSNNINSGETSSQVRINRAASLRYKK